MTMEVNETIQSLLGPLRAKRKPPEFKPRSRSLQDLPGGIRVPIIKAHGQTRLKDKLQETMAGLQELELLRDMHHKLVLDAKFSGVCKDNKRLYLPGTAFRCFSTSKLSDISEESTSSIEAEEKQDEPVQDSLKNRVSYSPYKTSLSKDTHSPSVRNRSVLINSSQELNSTQAVIGNVKETEETVFDEENFSYSGSSDAPELSKSVNIKGDNIRKAAEMQMRLRRSSFRCETVLTHHKTNPRFFQSTSAICNYPSPMHAVLRQFSSVSLENVSDRSRPILKETVIGNGNYHLNKDNDSPKITSTSANHTKCNNTKVENIAEDRDNHSGNMVVDTSLHRKTEYNVVEKNNETDDNNQDENSRRETTLDGTTVGSISKEANKEFIRVNNALDLTPKQGQRKSRRLSLPASFGPFSTSLSNSNLFRASNDDHNAFKGRLDYLSQTCQKDNDKVQYNNKCDLRGVFESEGNVESKSTIEVQNVDVANCSINLKTHRSFSEVQLHDPTTITRLHKTVRQTAV
ncbi:hypothetical protein CHS0354_012296 [Potamilus streckersoni]|uniref:Uncharacterized protein n=1 Tax=Potamilus streckersoni TaxID=2493646 RepID=A0AAE0SEZ7_9BIVA|nr:hypothetical protein CHS0354_012296 [Potamilus streckersoni]